MSLRGFSLLPLFFCTLSHIQTPFPLPVGTVRYILATLVFHSCWIRFPFRLQKEKNTVFSPETDRTHCIKPPRGHYFRFPAKQESLACPRGCMWRPVIRGRVFSDIGGAGDLLWFNSTDRVGKGSCRVKGEVLLISYYLPSISPPSFKSSIHPSSQSVS